MTQPCFIFFDSTHVRLNDSYLVDVLLKTLSVIINDIVDVVVCGFLHYNDSFPTKLEFNNIVFTTQLADMKNNLENEKQD